MKPKSIAINAFITAAALLTVGCGDLWEPKITSPERNAKVTPEAEKVAVHYELPEGITLGTAESCGETQRCGDVRLFLVSRMRNASGLMGDESCLAVGQEWNSRAGGEGSKGIIHADLSLCARRTKTYAVRVAVVEHQPADFPEAHRTIAISDEVPFEIPEAL